MENKQKKKNTTDDLLWFQSDDQMTYLLSSVMTKQTKQLNRYDTHPGK